MINIIEKPDLLAESVGFVPVEPIHATALDAVMAIRAILAPIHDPEFARQQIEKLVVSGEIPRWLGDELLKMRYPKKEGENERSLRR